MASGSCLERPTKIRTEKSGFVTWGDVRRVLLCAINLSLLPLALLGAVICLNACFVNSATLQKAFVN